MKCNYCGHEYSHGNFCPNCGAANNIDASSQNGQQNYQPPAQPQFRQQNQYQNTYGSSPMIQRRSIATCIILTIVTCGIYGIFWFISLTDDTRALSNDFTGASGGTAFVYTLITCGIYGFYQAYKQGERIDAARSAKGLAPANQGVVYLILTIFGLGIVAYALMQNEINNLT